MPSSSSRSTARVADVDQHSGFRGDPWGASSGRALLAETTLRTVETSERAVRIVGPSIDGCSGRHGRTAVRRRRPPSADLGARRRGGQLPAGARTVRRIAALSDERELYVAQAAEVARALEPTIRPPTPPAGRRLHAFRPELASTAAAREAARFLLLTPPVPWALRPG